MADLADLNEDDRAMVLEFLGEEGVTLPPGEANNTLQTTEECQFPDVTLASSMGLCTRARNSLPKAGINTLRDLSRWSLTNLVFLEGISHGSIENIRSFALAYGVRLRP